jgi:hypothetical protein
MSKAVLIVGMAVLCVGAALADEIAYWNFNDASPLDPNGSLWRINPLGPPENPLEYARDFGIGTAELSVWGTGDSSEGNLYGTNGSASSSPTQNFGGYSGTTLNAQHGDSAGDSLAMLGSNNDGRYFLLEIDDAISGCVLTYATRGTSTGYSNHVFDWSTDNGTTWHNWGTLAANKTSTWTITTVNFVDVFAGTAGHESNLIRIMVTGGGGTNGNNRFDNILISGTVVPEPASILLLGLGIALLRRR